MPDNNDLRCREIETDLFQIYLIYWLVRSEDTYLSDIDRGQLASTAR